MKKSYTEKDIKTLDPFSHIRERPGIYIGTSGMEADITTACTSS